MKKYFFLVILIAGVMACSAAPPPVELVSANETVFVEPDQVVTIFTQAVPEVTDIGIEGSIYQSSFLGDFFGENIDIIAIALLIFTTLFGGLWLTLRHKLKQIGDLFLKAYEYTDDKKLDAEERADLKRRFLEIFTRSPT